MDKQIVLRAQDIEKKIGKRSIVRNITFEVKAGEVFGFLGPNGAGKTTTIRMLVGLIRPTRGHIEICGYDLQKDFIHAMRMIGCIVENPELYKFLTGRENLEQFARMLGDVTPERIEEVVHLVDLDDRIDDKVKTYSLGMRQRLGIAQALLAGPKLLILDEPTNGLDPMGIREMREFIRRLADEEGISVFVSSHILSEIEMMCDRVAIISHGELMRVGTVEELLSNDDRSIEWDVSDTVRVSELVNTFFDEDRSVEMLENGHILCEMTSDEIPGLNQLLVSEGVDVYGIQRRAPTLEDLFIQVTGGHSNA